MFKIEYFESKVDELIQERDDIRKKIIDNLRFIQDLLNKTHIKKYSLHIDNLKYIFNSNQSYINQMIICLPEVIKKKRKTENRFDKHLLFKYSNNKISSFAKIGDLWDIGASIKYKNKKLLEYLKPFWVDFEKTKEIIYQDVIQYLQIPDVNKRYCPNKDCGKVLSDEEANFCAECGVKIE